MHLTSGKIRATLPLQEETANAERLSSFPWLLDDIPYLELVATEGSVLPEVCNGYSRRYYDKDLLSMMTLTRVHLAYGELVHVEYEAEDVGPEIWPGGVGDADAA